MPKTQKTRKHTKKDQKVCARDPPSFQELAILRRRAPDAVTKTADDWLPFDKEMPLDCHSYEFSESLQTYRVSRSRGNAERSSWHYCLAPPRHAAIPKEVSAYWKERLALGTAIVNMKEDISKDDAKHDDTKHVVQQLDILPDVCVPKGFIDARGQVVIYCINSDPEYSPTYRMSLERFNKDVMPVAKVFDPECKDALAWFTTASWFTSQYHKKKVDEKQGTKIEKLTELWEKECLHAKWPYDNNKFFQAHAVIMGCIYH